MLCILEKLAWDNRLQRSISRLRMFIHRCIFQVTVFLLSISSKRWHYNFFSSCSSSTKVQISINIFLISQMLHVKKRLTHRPISQYCKNASHKWYLTAISLFLLKFSTIMSMYIYKLLNKLKIFKRRYWEYFVANF